MTDDKKKWDVVETAIKKDKKPSQQELAHSMTIDFNKIKDPDTIIAKWKMKGVERKAAVEQLKSWYGSHLEVVKHQLEQAVEVKKKEADIDAQQYLAYINTRHLAYLETLGFTHVEQRQKALIKLGNQTSQMMNEAMISDWPDTIKNKTFDGIMDLYLRFFGKITEE